jgi:hypothetical protein
MGHRSWELSLAVQVLVPTLTTATYLSLRGPSEVASMSTLLPPGRQVLGYAITVYSVSQYIYSDSENASTSVAISPASSSSGLEAVARLSSYISSSLSSALSSGDIDAAIQSINIVSSSANTANCSLTPPFLLCGIES